MKIAIACAGALLACAGASADTPASAASGAAAAASGPHGPHVHVGRECMRRWPAEAGAPAPGSSTVRLGIDPSGHVLGATVIDASGPVHEPRPVDAAAILALASCPIDAGRDATGQPVAGDAVETWYWVPADVAHPRAGVPTGLGENGRTATMLRTPDNPNCQPQYPKAALRAEAQGTTTLQFKIDAAGRVLSTIVVRSAGATTQHKLLDEAATVMAGCTFVPGLGEDGTPHGAVLQQSYQWQLD